MELRRLRLSQAGCQIVTMIFLLTTPVFAATQASADDNVLDSAARDSAYFPDVTLPVFEEYQQPPNVHDLFALAKDLWDAGHRFEAVSAIDSAIALYPSSDFLWALKALFDKRLENYEYSLSEYNTAIRLAPEEAIYWHFRANILQALERFPEALASADSAIARDRNSVTYWNKRAFLLYWMHRYRESLEAMDSAIKYYEKNRIFPSLDIEDITLPDGKVINVWSDGESEATIEDENVIYHPGETTPFWAVRAGSLMELGRYEEAINFFDSSLAEDPSATGYWLDRARCFIKMCRYEDAANSVDSAQKYNEDSLKQKDIQYMRANAIPPVQDSAGN